MVAAHPIVSHPFPRGKTSKEEEIVILTWRDLEFFSQVHIKGEWYRTYCPIHGSGQERSLAIKAATGFGHCFDCEAKVFVADFDPQMALLLQQQGRQKAFPSRPRTPPAYPRMPPTYPRMPPAYPRTPRSPNKRRQVRETPEKPAEEWQLLHALQDQGDFHLDRETAWNAQAYLEARKIPLEITSHLGIAYVAMGTADQYGEWVRPWEDRLIFPLLTAGGEVGFIGRLITHWQCCRDAAAHQARLRAEGLEPWRKTGSQGWFWDPERLPSSDPIIVVDGPFDRLAILADGAFEPGEVVALAGMAFQPAWLSSVSAALFAFNQSQSKEAGERFKQHLSWKNVRMDLCCLSTKGSSWSERWRREGADGLELLYADHARLANGL
jgi:hypothetical protein